MIASTADTTDGTYLVRWLRLHVQTGITIVIASTTAHTVLDKQLCVWWASSCPGKTADLTYDRVLKNPQDAPNTPSDTRKVSLLW
jgi:hypothetical protein